MKDKTFDLKVLSGMLRRLRQERGLSPVALASEVDKPVWLIDLLEHAEEEAAGELCSLLPPQEIEAVLEEMEARYGVCCEDAPSEAIAEPEVTFYLPLTMSAERAMDMIDELLLFAVDGAGADCKRRQILQRGVVSAGLLVHMLSAHHKQAGRTTEAQQSLTRFQEMLQERLRECG